MTRTRRGDGGVVLGVDLGTCYSAAAVCLDGVDAEVLHNDIGDPTTPTCVYVDPDGADRQVGEAAVRLAVSDPGRTVRNVKRILGVTLDAIKRDSAGLSDALGSVEVVPADGLGADRAAVRVGSAGSAGSTLDLAPEEVAGSVLLELRKAAEARVGRAVRRAVLAVPGYFNAAQRSAVRDAAALAGLEDVRLVNETSAAALAYAHGREGQGPRNVVVVDVGGGGGAVSIVEVRNDSVRVLASSGVRLPGGEDFDREMVEYLKQVVKEEHGKDVADPRSLELLRVHWERAKRKLMQLPHTKIDTFLPGDVDVALCRLVKRAEFEERCEPLFRRVAEQLRATLQEAEVGVEAVHDVVLVGGSTRIPRLRALVQEVVAGRPLCKALNADEAVARGAALLGEDLVRLQDVTPLQLAALGGGDPLLRNSPLPADGRMPGADSGDTVVVRQGCLGADAALTVVFEATRASLPDVHAFRLDESGLLHLVDERGGDVGELCLRGCLSAAALADLRAGTERRQRSNLANLERAEAKNRLEERCRALLAAENEVADDHPDAPHAAALRKECEGLMRWLYSEEEQRQQPDVHEYRRRLQDVEGLQERLVACREERKRVDAVRKVLDTMCLDVMDREPEVADGHPDAALVRELRHECSEHLAWLQRQEACTERDVVERRDAVEVRRLRLQARREAAAVRSDLEEQCAEILRSELKDFAGLSETCQSTLQWLGDTRCASKEDYERRLTTIESLLPDARAAAAEAKAAAEAAWKLEVKCREILGGEWKAFPELADECRLQLEWLARRPRAAEADYIARERDVERRLVQAKAAHTKAVAEAARAEPAARAAHEGGAGAGPSYAKVASGPAHHPAHGDPGGSRKYKTRTIRSGEQRRHTPPYGRGQDQHQEEPQSRPGSIVARGISYFKNKIFRKKR